MPEVVAEGEIDRRCGLRLWAGREIKRAPPKALSPDFDGGQHGTTTRLKVTVTLALNLTD